MNTDTGFSIVKYTGTGEVNGTLPHGLDGKLGLTITKDIKNDGDYWHLDHKDLSDIGNLFPNRKSSEYKNSSDGWVDGKSTHGLIKFRTYGSTVAAVNESGVETICYCWVEIPGYSKFGTYVGSGSTGLFVYTGFKPAFVLTKESRHNSPSTSSSYTETYNAGRWVMYDNASSPYNGAPAVAQHIYLSLIHI